MHWNGLKKLAGAYPTARLCGSRVSDVPEYYSAEVQLIRINVPEARTHNSI